MKEAIQKAIEGGYETPNMSERTGTGILTYNCLLDPAFWQSLGKAMGWEKRMEVAWGIVDEEHGGATSMKGYCMPEWQYHQHRFIDHLVEGKDAESFFNNLLT